MVSSKSTVKYPGIPAAMDGNSVVIMCERESSDAAGAYPITPSTQMGEYWAEETAKGHINISGKPLIFIEPEGEHAAAGVTAGMSMTGLRASNFSSGQGIAYMHESLYGAVGKRLPYILNVGCRAITKTTLNVHAGHDDYHLMDDTGFFQVLGKNGQAAADLNIISRKIAELSLTPGAVGQDGFLTTHLIETLRVPERELIEEYLGKPSDLIDSPTPAQKLLYGEKRRRVPILWDVDNPVLSGSAQNQEAYMQSVAAQRPYFFEHIPEIADQCFAEFEELTGRKHARVSTYRCEDADYLLLAQGSILGSAEAVVDYLRETRGVKVGVVDLTMFRPFPGDLLGPILKGRKGVVIPERTDQPLAEDLPVIREVRATISKCMENGLAPKGEKPYAGYDSYTKQGDAPPLYSCSFGMGSRDLQPEAVIGAIENMLPDGAKKKFFYLSIDFLHKKNVSPKNEIHQQNLLEKYPNIGELEVKGSENPNLLPEGAITVRMHSVGGWGAITTGKNLAITLNELLGYDIKANPKYGSEKKGQPTTYYLSAAPEPIRINCEYYFVDTVLSPDPNVFSHSNPLFGLKKGGTFIIQSDLDSPEAVWESFPIHSQRFIKANNIKVVYLDAFKIAREEATDPELQFRMQGIAFQGAFFAASNLMETANFTEESLFKSIHEQIEYKFGSKGARVVEDNIRVVRRGFDEIHEIKDMEISTKKEPSAKKETALPLMLKRTPASSDPKTDTHRFWEQTGSFYLGGRPNDQVADPFAALALIPANTGLYRNMTQIRFQHPVWHPEKCTSCSDCFTVCPDAAIPGLAGPISAAFETTIKRIQKAGHEVKLLPKAVRTVEKKLRAAAAGINGSRETASLDTRPLLIDAISDTIAEATEDKENLIAEFELFRDAIGDFKFALTKPYYDQREKSQSGSGGLYSITVNPYTCKGCMLCVDVCEDGALTTEDQTKESVAKLEKEWDYWLDLPTTPKDYMRIDDLDEKIGALETMLMDKSAYNSMSCGDGACTGCGEKSVLHLFTGTVTALMQRRVKKHVEYIGGLIEKMETHLKNKLAETVNISDTDAIKAAVARSSDKDLNLSSLAGALDEGTAGTPLDQEWLTWMSDLLAKLKDLKWRYEEGTTKTGRAMMGFQNATGCSSIYGSSFPYNPYPFPWSNHLFQDAPSVALGLFEGHMRAMGEGFKAIRQAEAELSGKDFKEFEKTLTYFDWNSFTDDEYLLCPPVVAVGGDGAMFDIGFQNVSRVLMSGRPIKIFVLDTQVYSNTGGQACTSGYIGQVSDMAPYGKAWKGKKEIRKEMALIGAAHRTAFIMQGNIANYTHLIEGYIDGINARRPALFSIYSVCQPEHGVPDDASAYRSKMALESRAYPVFRFDPDAGESWEDCIELEGNPSMDDDWPVYTLKYVDDDGNEQSMELPMTFADFAVQEGRFRKHFRVAPADTWNDNMVPLVEFLDMDEDDREGLFPYIWSVDKKNRLMRVLVAAEIVQSTEERRDYWRTLKGIAGLTKKVDPEAIAQQVRSETAQKLAQGLMNMLAGAEGAPIDISAAAAPAASGEAPAAAASNGFEPAWIDQTECSSCDECVVINPKIFEYDDGKKAFVKDPKGGPFKDIVRAAEKCTGKCIHPGTPADPSEKGVDKLIKRAEKFQ
ncbi:2-oxoacid:acceptor oxidoreductase family protein [Pelagicoccus mobilis]|uniref:2-oxoacid:acceptor oxidoreductase family protein n=1 Tax=Pelagicoccus mobilis TaxID=415221 RepID=A0A934S161_9BACT|nr:2-oxoacid:acceptor oxidoreductase family protein [Pelagicoccus mobilis]MBK1877554.1 2-oxoacid:acceptor oxidoreductase family protein [Pelagicoccus mobilis]